MFARRVGTKTRLGDTVPIGFPPRNDSSEAKEDQETRLHAFLGHGVGELRMMRVNNVLQHYGRRR